MTDLIYKEPETPYRLFAVGDQVEVLDRDHTVLGKQTVKRASKKSLTTDCGRRWTQDGWWIGSEQAWPFPSIRHARKARNR